MVRTAYERASKKMRSAFIHKLEMDIGKHSHAAEGEQELAFPGDVLAETCLKFVESTIRLPETRWGAESKETKEEMADNRARAAIAIEYICKTKTPKNEQLTLEQIAEDFRNLTASSPLEDDSESIVNPQFTEWIRRVIENRIERLRKPYDRAVKDEYLETGVDSKILSLGVAPLLIAGERERIQEYEEIHISLRSVPDRMQAARLALYTSNLACLSQSQPSAASHDRSQTAIAARRNEAGGAAGTEVARRARRLLAHRENRRRRQAIEK